MAITYCVCIFVNKSNIYIKMADNKDNIEYLDLSGIEVDYYGLTETEFIALSAEELMDIEIKISTDRVNVLTSKFKKIFKHFVGFTSFSILSLIFGYGSPIYVPLIIMTSIIFGYLIKIRNDRKWQLIRHNMGIGFYESFGIANNTNRHVYTKYNIDGLWDEYVDIINKIINKF